MIKADYAEMAISAPKDMCE